MNAVVPLTRTLQRYPDWAPRLNEYVVQTRDLDYKWGTHDCCTFAAGGVEAITGWDPMWAFRGQYTTEEEGDDALEIFGAHKGLYPTLIKLLGSPVRGSQGQKGDVGFYEGCCGVVLGKWSIFIGIEGYVYVPITQLQRAFRINDTVVVREYP